MTDVQIEPWQWEELKEGWRPFGLLVKLALVVWVLATGHDLAVAVYFNVSNELRELRAPSPMVNPW